MKNKFAIFLVLSLLPAVSAYPQKASPVKFKARPVKFKLEKYVFRDEPEYAGDSTRLIEILSYDEGENQVEIPVSEAETLSTISMVCEKPFKYYYKNYGNSDSTGNRPKLLKDSDYFFTVTYDPYQPVISNLPPVGYFLLGNIMVLIAKGTVPPFLKREGTVMTFDTYYRDYDVRNLDDMGKSQILNAIFLNGPLSAGVESWPLSLISHMMMKMTNWSNPKEIWIILVKHTLNSHEK